MKRFITAMGLALAILALASCVAPPGQSYWLVLDEQTQLPAKAGGQIGEVPPSTLNLTTVGFGISVSQALCVVVSVFDEPPPYDMASISDEVVHQEEHCSIAPLFTPGVQTTTYAGLLADWDEASQGQLEGKWLFVSGISQRFPPASVFSPLQLRSATFDGSAPMVEFCGEQIVAPC